MDKNYSITLDGFKTKAQAAEFLRWYCNSGEQAFYEHLDVVGLNTEDGCCIDSSKKQIESDKNITAFLD